MVFSNTFRVPFGPQRGGLWEAFGKSPGLAGLPVGPPLMFASVQAGLGLYLQACRRPCRHGCHEPEASGFNALVFCHSVCYS